MILKELRITQLCSQNEWTLVASLLRQLTQSVGLPKRLAEMTFYEGFTNQPDFFRPD